MRHDAHGLDLMDLLQRAIDIITPLDGQHRILDLTAQLADVEASECIREPHIAPLPKSHIHIDMKARQT